MIVSIAVSEGLIPCNYSIREYLNVQDLSIYESEVNSCKTVNFPTKLPSIYRHEVGGLRKIPNIQPILRTI